MKHRRAVSAQKTARTGTDTGVNEHTQGGAVGRLGYRRDVNRLLRHRLNRRSRSSSTTTTPSDSATSGHRREDPEDLLLQVGLRS
jgi:hypothetical protein